ncbi:MAG: PPOX class F420-dependent oxidoreductase [Thermomicrobiales bacterium]
MFDEHEVAFLASQRLARLATVAANGQPDCDAVGFEFDGERFYIGGMALPRSRKYKNIAGGNRLVSLIVDDLASVDPWRPRGIKLHGMAEIVTRDGRFGAQEYFAITPSVSWSWGLVGDDFYAMKKTIWASR